MKTYRYLLSIIMTLTIGLPAPDLSAQGNFTQLGRWAYGIQEEMYFIDQTGYISCGANLIIADFSDPLNPVELDKITVDKFINHFIIVDHYLYIGDQRILWIFDIAEPTEPQFMDSVYLATPVGQLYYDQDHLYQTGGDILTVFDLSTRNEPSLVTTIDLDAYVDDLDFYENYIYCSTGGGGMDSLILINRSDFDNPLITKVQVTHSGYINTCAVMGQYLFIGTLDSLIVMSLSDPAQPVREHSLFTGWVYDISIFDQVAFLTRQGHGLALYDISDPLAPAFLSRIEYWASKAKFRSPYVYTLGNGGGPIYIHDLTDMALPGIDVGRITYGDQNNALEVEDNIGYLAQGSQLVILDLNDPAQIRQIASVAVDDCSSLAVNDGYCYVAARWAGWSVFNITNPEDPMMVKKIGTVDRVEDIKIRGHHAYLADWGGGIRIYDILDPGNPIELGRYVTEKDFQRLILVDSFVYAFERQFGLKIIDITDKENPIAVDSIAYPGFIETMIWHDSLVYLGMNGNNKILNINDPAHPFEYDLTHYWQAVEDLAISSGTLYVAEESGGLSLFDISSDPLNPAFIGKYDHPYLTSMVTPANNLIYLVDRVAGIYVLRFDYTTSVKNKPDAQEISVDIYPNPTSEYLNLSYSGPSRQELILTLRNVNGQIFFKKNIVLDQQIQQLNIQDLPTGIYLLNIRNQIISHTVKFVHTSL